VFNRDYIGVYIGANRIRIMLGNRKKIKHWETVDIVKKDLVEENIDVMDFVYSHVKKFIRQNKANANEISFCISDSDIVTRLIEVPIINKKSLKGSVEWEMNRYLPGGGNSHYIDFQIIDKIDNEEKKVYKLLVAAVPKERADKLTELSDRLKLKLRAVDISANCIARIFKGEKNNRKLQESVGVIKLGDKTSSIIILDKGNLFVEREVPFGTENVIREIGRGLQVDEKEAEHYLREVFDFETASEDIEVDNRILTMFDNVLSSFLKVIQFYTTGRVKKLLDEIFISGSACYIHGLEDHIENYFNSPASIITSSKSLPSKIKVPEECDVKLYLEVIGLLLRRE
jgi:type IV pilus assembly protein PilM